MSISAFIVVCLCISIINVKAQSNDLEIQKSLIIERNDDNTLEKVEAVFTNNLTLDSLVEIKKELQAIGITLHYKKMEFNTHDLLTHLESKVICNDGFSGSFKASHLDTQNKNKRIGFARDYSSKKKAIQTGVID